MKDVVTAQDVQSVPPGGELSTGLGAIVTPWARELAATRGDAHRARRRPPRARWWSRSAPTTAASR